MLSNSAHVTSLEAVLLDNLISPDSIRQMMALDLWCLLWQQSDEDFRKLVLDDITLLGNLICQSMVDSRTIDISSTAVLNATHRMLFGIESALRRFLIFPSDSVLTYFSKKYLEWQTQPTLWQIRMLAAIPLARFPLLGDVQRRVLVYCFTVCDGYQEAIPSTGIEREHLLACLRCVRACFSKNAKTTAASTSSVPKSSISGLFRLLNTAKRAGDSVVMSLVVELLSLIIRKIPPSGLLPVLTAVDEAYLAFPGIRLATWSLARECGLVRLSQQQQSPLARIFSRICDAADWFVVHCALESFLGFANFSDSSFSSMMPAPCRPLFHQLFNRKPISEQVCGAIPNTDPTISNSIRSKRRREFEDLLDGVSNHKRTRTAAEESTSCSEAVISPSPGDSVLDQTWIQDISGARQHLASAVATLMQSDTATVQQQAKQLAEQELELVHTLHTEILSLLAPSSV